MQAASELITLRTITSATSAETALTAGSTSWVDRNRPSYPRWRAVFSEPTGTAPSSATVAVWYKEDTKIVRLADVAYGTTANRFATTDLGYLGDGKVYATLDAIAGSGASISFNIYLQGYQADAE